MVHGCGADEDFGSSPMNTYKTFIQALRTHDLKRAMKCYSPNLPARHRQIVRLGLDLTRYLVEINYQVVSLYINNKRALLSVRENALFQYKNGRFSRDTKTRRYRIYFEGSRWYIQEPDLGPILKSTR